MVGIRGGMEGIRGGRGVEGKGAKIEEISAHIPLFLFY